MTIEEPVERSFLPSMSNLNEPTDDTLPSPATQDLLARSRQKLSDFFQNKRIKSLVSILVPGALAAALLPVFGPVVASAAAAVAIKNGLSLLGIVLSDDTIKKLVKPLEGQTLDEDDAQDILQTTLEQLLPQDQQVNDEAAKALVAVAPIVKQAALTNPKLDAMWLGENLETNLTQQGETMAKIASKLRHLVQMENRELEAGVKDLLQHWMQITVEVTASEDSTVSDIMSKAKATGGAIKHKVAADVHSKIEKVDIQSEIN